jgi:outer membrane lipoprotein SlyB
MRTYHAFHAIALLFISGTLVSCVAPHPDPYVRQGRRGGAVVGGVTGAVIGNNVKGGNSWGGAAIGAAVGGLAGDQRGKVNSMYYRQGYRYY